ncbi:MAG: succinate dehydrogenase cytochrome b subunit [Planctomycetaceae bacterium]|nr:succinate dehydrogenase cytochrome b subunit [Planctomycetaceae bacterium]
MIQTIRAAGSFWLLRVFGSTIGRKLVMAVTGLGLCGFLIMHLAGNLLLYVGAEEYNHYADTLHAQAILLTIAEIGLLILFVGHIVLAFTTDRENSAARPVGYAMKQTKQPPSGMAAPASSIMMATGIVVLLFLLLHLADFRFSALGIRKHDGDDHFTKAVNILRDPLSAGVYIVGSLVLGYHVLHGFQSAFQTLGFNHPKYTPIIKFLSGLFAATVALGFGSFPLWAWAIQK